MCFVVLTPTTKRCARGDRLTTSTLWSIALVVPPPLSYLDQLCLNVMVNAALRCLRATVLVQPSWSPNTSAKSCLSRARGMLLSKTCASENDANTLVALLHSCLRSLPIICYSKEPASYNLSWLSTLQQIKRTSLCMSLGHRQTLRPLTHQAAELRHSRHRHHNVPQLVFVWAWATHSQLWPHQHDLNVNLLLNYWHMFMGVQCGTCWLCGLKNINSHSGTALHSCRHAIECRMSCRE